MYYRRGKMMPLKPTYEELLQKIKALEEEKNTWWKESADETTEFRELGPAEKKGDFLTEAGSLGTIINVGGLQSIMDDFHSLTGMVTAILDMNGTVIESTGWKDICTKFHRVHPETALNCTESDLYLVKNIKPGEYLKYRCKNGLWDVVTPLYIGNMHLGNIYTGQFFYDDDVVDEQKFIRQAETYGFDKETYLDAFHRIPRYSREVIDHLMNFLVKFTSYISNVGYANMTLSMEIKERKRAEDQLRESREQLSEAMNMARAGHWEYDVSSDTFTFNDHFYRIFRTTAEEVGGYHMSSAEYARRFCHPNDMYLVANEIKKVIETSDPDYSPLIEHRIIYSNGEVGYIAVRFFVSKDAQGRTIRTFGVNQDITESKLAEETLRKMDAMLAKIASQVPGLLYQFMKKPDGSYSVPYSSNGIKEIFGCSPEDVRNDFSPILNVIHPEDREKLLQTFDVSAKNLSQWTCEFRVQLPDQPVKWMFGNSIPEKRADGSIVWSGYNTDITERLQGQEALRESEERLQLVMEGSQLGYWDWDIETGKVRRNTYWAEMLGYTLEEVEHTVNQWSDLHHPDDTAAAWKSIQDQLKGKTPAHRAEYRMRGKDGHYRWILDQARVVKRDADGKPLRMCGTHTDITEFKQLEQERQNLQAQLAQAQKMESVGRLAGGVAHDFNNMLSVIIGNVGMAQEEVDPTLPLYENLEETRKAAERSADLVRQLLAFARKQTVSPKVIDINKTISGTTNMLRRLIGEDIDLEWLPGMNVWPVKIDPSQIDQILANLCVNARDAITDVGKITIETGNSEFDEAYCAAHQGFLLGTYVLLAVSDNGCGMNPTILDNIFEPFFTTKETGKGTGLGLAMVYGVVKQNNGFINVYSEPGHGTTFKIYLPRYQIQAESLPKQTRNPLTEYGYETILLVEDEPSILKMTTRMLERLGYRVVAANTPGEAIRFAQEYADEIHLLVTDVIMPEMNGRDLANTILTMHPKLRRLFMSGYTANVIAHHGVLDEGVSFIQKPFSREQLGARVREALDKGNIRSQSS
jgi:PAS domain S-box-containing protein